MLKKPPASGEVDKNHPGLISCALPDRSEAHMPKRKISTTYGKAATTPSRRKVIKPKPVEMRQPQAASPLHQYVQDNEESGLSVAELIQQFQEYDCEHREWEQISWSTSYLEFRCVGCRKIEKRKRTGL
jgi:hypothetical protein